jgi:hypothetical protein
MSPVDQRPTACGPFDLDLRKNLFDALEEALKIRWQDAVTRAADH